MKKWSVIIKQFLFLLITLFIFAILSNNAFAKIPTSGLVTNLEDVPLYKNEEFDKYPVRLNIFTASWCNRCAKLKQTLPKKIYEKFNKEQVAIRIWEIDDSNVIPYLIEMEKKLNVPEKARGSTPCIFINETYYYAGYDGNILDNLIKDIDAILKGKEVPVGGNLREIKETNQTGISQDRKEVINDKNIDKTQLDRQINQIADVKNNRFNQNNFIIFKIIFFLLLLFTCYTIYVYLKRKKHFRKIGTFKKKKI